MADIVLAETAEEWFVRGNKAIKAGEYDEAIRCYKKTISINSDLEGAHYNLAIAYGKRGMNYLSADHFYKAGLLYLKQEDREGALHAYEGLKLAKSKKLEESLYKQLYPEVE